MWIALCQFKQDPLLSVVKHPSTTISRSAFQCYFWPAESNCNIHLSIALLVLAVVAKTPPNFRFSNFCPTVSSINKTPRLDWSAGLEELHAQVGESLFHEVK